MTFPPTLAAVDARIDALGPRLSLCADRPRATSLSALALAAPADLRSDFEACLARIGHAQVEAFPENIFWDFDAIAHSLLDQAQRSTDAPALLRERAESMAALQGLFGGASVVRFRYVHDFSYGFDWAKWVRRAPEARASESPFGAGFLAYSLRRGRELLDLIARDDAKYPKLPEGQPRNPFSFSRSVPDETRLFRALAEADLIPVRAWESHPAGQFTKDYQALRKDLAEGLAKDPARSELP